jgi:hypothetical protein
MFLKYNIFYHISKDKFQARKDDLKDTTSALRRRLEVIPEAVRKVLCAIVYGCRRQAGLAWEAAVPQ